MGRKKPSVEITTPGQPAPTRTESPAARRIALTVKLGPEDYQRLETLKARRMVEGRNDEASTQAVLSEAVREFLDRNGV